MLICFQEPKKDRPIWKQCVQMMEQKVTRSHFRKVAQKVTKAVFSFKSNVLQSGPKCCQFLVYFCEKILVDKAF